MTLTPQIIPGHAIWRRHAEKGIPVEITLFAMSTRQEVPEWESLLEAAKKDGANIPRLVRRLEHAVSDSYTRQAGEKLKTLLRDAGEPYQKEVRREKEEEESSTFCVSCREYELPTPRKGYTTCPVCGQKYFF